MRNIIQSFGSFFIFWVIIGGFWIGISNEITIRNVSISAALSMICHLSITSFMLAREVK